MRLISLSLLMAGLLAACSLNAAPSTPRNMQDLVPHELPAPTLLLQGRITLLAQTKHARLSLVGSNSRNTDPRRTLPNMVFDVVQSQSGEVIPLQRSLQLSDNPYWDYIVGVGKIWQDTDNKQTHIVALPFALVEKNENCVHNGIITFDIDTQDQSSGRFKSEYYYQISSETCAYFKADFWGRGESKFEDKQYTNAALYLQHYQQEQQHRLNTQTLSQLSTRYPELSLAGLALTGQIKAQDMTTYGLVVNDVHYVADCPTRAGLYPFCEQLVLPSYSTAKSIFAGLSMFYLQQQYGDVFTQKVQDWVPQCLGKQGRSDNGQNEQWQDVTFVDLLNMSSGNYHSAAYHVDEGADATLTFFNATTHQDKLNFACGHYPHQSPAGERFVYHTSDTYLLTAALNNYLKSKRGDKVDIFTDIVVNKIFAQLRLSALSNGSRRTQDAEKQAYGGYGLFFNTDDIAKLSLFINQQSASLATEPRLLAQGPLNQALQRSAEPFGLTTDFSTIRYWHSFWARNIDSLQLCDSPTWLPFMSGYGGITIALLANNTSYYYFSDSHQYDWSSALPELAKLQSLCHPPEQAKLQALQED